MNVTQQCISCFTLSLGLLNILFFHSWYIKNVRNEIYFHFTISHLKSAHANISSCTLEAASAKRRLPFRYCAAGSFTNSSPSNVPSPALLPLPHQWRCQKCGAAMPSGPRLIKAPVSGRRRLQVCQKPAEPDFLRWWERFVAAWEGMSCS